MNSKITISLLIFVGLTASGYVSESVISIESVDGHSPIELVKIEQSTKIVAGVLSGFDCAVVGELCPTTHRGADYTTGVFTEEDKFYFIVNIPQSFLQQYFRETIKVEGTAYDPYNHAVEPEIIYLIEEDERRVIYESGYFIDENNNRATFQDGVFQNGRWTVQE